MTTKPKNESKNGAYVHGPRGNVTNLTKVERYGWAAIGQPGELAWLDKESLHVSEEYQRSATESKVHQIAADWDWIAAGAIIVARRDGVNWVVDGQHRVLASRKRADIDRLPCVVFQTSTVKEEAAGFLGANTLRKPLTSIQKFRAMCKEGDHAAILLYDHATASNYAITESTTSNTRTVRCVTALMKQIREDSALFVKLWPLYVEVAAGGPIAERVADSIFYIEKNLADTPHSLLRQPWRARLIGLGTDGILEAAFKAAAFYSRGGAKCWAIGVVQALNYKVQKRLSVPGIEV